MVGISVPTHANNNATRKSATANVKIKPVIFLAFFISDEIPKIRTTIQSSEPEIASVDENLTAKAGLAQPNSRF